MKKISRKVSHEGFCSTSLDILKEKAISFFEQKKGITKLWFVDHYEHPPRDFFKDPNDVYDIVLFGDFLKRFLESGNWPLEKMRMWVLCERAKNILMELFHIPTQKVGIIPRYELFPLNIQEKKIEDYLLSQKWTFVYAGRISPTKNIEFIIFFTYYLQKYENRQVELIFFGEFDNESFEDRGRFVEESYEEKIVQIITSLEDWENPPKFLGKHGADEWIEHSVENPILINMSTFMCEDFGVSVAQAQQKGWPCFLSDWGGHCDVEGTNVVKIDPIHIGKSFEVLPIIKSKAKILAKEFTNLISSNRSAQNNLSSTNSNTFPEITTISSLDSLRRQFVKKWGTVSILSNRDQLPWFADTSSGSLFFYLYRQKFGKKSCSKKFVFLLLGNNEKKDEVVKDYEYYEKKLNEYEKINVQGIEHLYYQNLNYKESLLVLSEANKVFSSSNENKLTSFIEEIIN